ncbi:VWA domain-containing protein [Thermogutta sp.]|uniref:vWA domain-containing protein n=1 Tax=Thermogutta sp. TaxID=1962930 RepID=UPI00321FF604
MVTLNTGTTEEPETLKSLGGKSGNPRFWYSFGISTAFHALLFALLFFALRPSSIHGLTEQNVREVGIALKYQNGPREYYVDESGQVGEEAQAGLEANSGRPTLDEILPSVQEADADALPRKGFEILGPSGLLETGAGHSGGKEGLFAGGGGFGRQPGPAGTASLFGIRSPGHKFVYVFDRSGSMGGSGRTALSFAKRELIASIQSLDKTQQFQIIFYNERPTLFNPAGQPGRLSFATDENKLRAIRFIQSITAGGGTQHDAALLAAIQLRPDVIFFLTDADEPRLSEAKLEQIHRWANGIVIHAIEFGTGPEGTSDNFLKRIARQNGGQYVYIDITQALR